MVSSLGESKTDLHLASRFYPMIKINGYRDCLWLINKTCSPLIGELGTYLWDEKFCKIGEDKPLKERDHGPDALRYFANSLPDWRFEVVQTK